MAAVTLFPTLLIDCPNCNPTVKFSRRTYHFAAIAGNSIRRRKSRESSSLTCSASDGPSSSEIRENNAKNAQIARFSREESLSNLKLRIDEKRILPLSAFRGIARLVILAGPASFIEESLKLSEPFSEGILERGLLVVPFATDGISLNFEFEEKEVTEETNSKRKRLWQLAPVYAADWTKWLDEQKKLANVSSESPVYLSLRLDGRVRGSGVGLLAIHLGTHLSYNYHQ